MIDAAPLIACEAPAVMDGDSLRCRNIGPVRLLGVDAPDYRNSRPCRERFGDHVCSDAGARRAKASLRQGLRLGPVRLLPAGRDRYRRLLAVAYAGGTNLNCLQLRAGRVRYIARYDSNRIVSRACGL